MLIWIPPQESGFQGSGITAPLGCRAYHRLAEPQSPPRKGLRGHNRKRRNVADDRERQAALTQARQSMLSPTNYESDS
jgi:hypothetical protein